MGIWSEVRLLAGVRPLVPRNGVLVAEAPWAHRASVRLFTGVGPLVRRNDALVAVADRDGAGRRVHGGAPRAVGGGDGGGVDRGEVREGGG